MTCLTWLRWCKKRGGVLPRDADPRRGRGERGVRGGQEPERAARPDHGQRARRAREAWPRHSREGVDADRVHHAQGVLAAVRGQVPGRHRAIGDEAHGRVPGVDRVIPHHQRIPIQKNAKIHTS